MLQALLQKKVLVASSVTELDACLKERDVNPSDTALTPSPPHGAPRDAYGSASSPGRTAGTAAAPPAAAPVGRLDKRQIEQRIEEDRERHKRLKESIWGVEGDGDAEFRRLWDEVSEIGEDDYLAAEEEAMERQRAVEMEYGERGH